MIKLAIAGIGGRMGQRILALAIRDADFSVVYGLDRQYIPGISVPTGSDVTALYKTDVVIDFSAPEVSLVLAEQAAEKKFKLVIGTTGFGEAEEKMLSEAARKTAIVKAPNMSLGVNVFFKLAQEAARALGYDAEIIETHHVHKKDKPSGTALFAGGLIEKATGKNVKYQSLREGEVVGDHKVIFTGPSERIELFHHAGSRDTFAAGALQAAKWVVKQKPGLYGMKDVLGL